MDSSTQELQFTGGAAQYLKEIKPVLQEREAMQVALVNILQTLLGSEIPDDYEGMNLECGPYRLRALCFGVDVTSNEDVLYCTFSRMVPFGEEIPKALPRKICLDHGSGELCRSSMIGIALHERELEEGGYCTQVVYMEGREGEIFVGTGLSFGEIFERSGGEVKDRDVKELIAILRSKNFDKGTGIFLFGKKGVEVNIDRIMRKRALDFYMDRFSRKTLGK